jgi:membrane protease YdiL (CAAX protease family)
MKNFIRQHSLVLFFTSSFAISWIGILLSFGEESIHLFRGENVLAGEYSNQLILIWLSMLAGPGISGIFFTLMTKGNQGLKQLFGLLLKRRIHIKWYVVALLLFPVILLSVFYGLSLFSAKFYPAAALMPGLMVGLIGSFFEEIGWTGFAMRNLATRVGFMKTAVILGIVHSFWHLPADYLGSDDFYKELYFFHFILWIIALTVLRFVVIWIYKHTGSLLLAVLTHASFTGSQLMLTPPFLSGPETMLWYVIFVVALIVLASVIIIRDRALAATGAVI